MEDEKFDCIIVGGGIAGLSAAITLARHNIKFVLIERGEFSGAKNVSGGVLWGTQLSSIVPNYWEEKDSWERYIHKRRLTFMDEQSAMTVDFDSQHYNAKPYSGLIVLRSRFDRWLANKVQEAIDDSGVATESFIATNILVEKIIEENDRVGVQCGQETFYSDSIILAEGVNNILTRQVDIQSKYVPADHVLIGIKEIIQMDRDIIENRFNLQNREGMSNEYIGYATDGVEGGGFLYTNLDSLSLGLVLSIADLRKKKKEPYEILSHFKAHPAIQRLIDGGKTVEYSAHTVSSGDIRLMPKKLYKNRLLVCGEAAHLLLNAGKAIQGMDYAMYSGILAAETIIDAKQKNNYSTTNLCSYQQKLEGSYVGKEMKTWQPMVHAIHHPMMYQTMPKIICDVGRSFFTIDDNVSPSLFKILKKSTKKHTKIFRMIRFIIKMLRSL